MASSKKKRGGWFFSSAAPEVPVVARMNPGDVIRRVWKMPKAGRISSLTQEDQVLPAPGPQEVRVSIRAIGLNFADVFATIGLYSATPKGEWIPGLEYSGVIDSVGPGVKSLAPGDRVFGFTRFGAYVTHVTVPELYCRKMPEGWSFAEAASFVVQGLTAWHAMVELAAVKKGMSVLVHSAAGGVGQLAMELCEKLGCYPIATIGSEAKVGFLMDRFKISRDQIIVRDAKPFATQLDENLKAIGREGYDVILDALGGSYFKEGYKRLSRGGRLITYGAATFMSSSDGPNWFKIIPKYLTRPVVDPGDMCQENRGVLGFNLIWLTDKVVELNAELDDMSKYEWRPPHVGASFPFDRLPEAVKALQSGKTVGKVVVMVDG